MNPVFCKRTFCRAMAALILMAAASQPAVVLAADWSIDQLMQALSKNKQGRATFIEKKYVAVLEWPVESSGELSYSAPDRLEKKTLKPRPETMLLEGGVLTIERGRKKQVLQLQDYPELAGLLDSIRGTLTGDRKALERSFSLKLAGNAKRWTLTLTPTDARLARIVARIDIEGRQDNVSNIEILETGGDRSSMAIERIGSQ